MGHGRELDGIDGRAVLFSRGMDFKQDAKRMNVLCKDNCFSDM